MRHYIKLLWPLVIINIQLANEQNRNVSITKRTSGQIIWNVHPIYRNKNVCHHNVPYIQTRNRLCLHRITWPRKPTPTIKPRVASYHTTKVIVHKVSYSKLHPKIGCLSTCRLPSNTWFLGPSESTTQTASRSVQPFFVGLSVCHTSEPCKKFLQGSLMWQTDRPTDRRNDGTTDRQTMLLVW